MLDACLWKGDPKVISICIYNCMFRGDWSNDKLNSLKWNTNNDVYPNDKKNYATISLLCFFKGMLKILLFGSATEFVNIQALALFGHYSIICC